MEKFEMSASARYRDGSTGDAFAAVSAASPAACFDAIKAEVKRWLSQALVLGKGEGFPQAIELTLEWGGAPAQEPAPDGPKAPSDPIRCNVHPRRRGLTCTTRFRLGGRAGVGALPMPSGTDAEPLVLS